MSPPCPAAATRGRLQFPWFLSGLLLAGILHAAPSLDIRSTATPPVIDGRLDDAAWTTAAHSDALRQVSPRENADPTERTEFWVTFDSNHFYVAVRSHDSAGLAGISAYSLQRDQDNDSDDLVGIVLDTFNRQSDGYFFGLSAAGGLIDGLVQDKDQSNDDWDGLWHGRVTRDAGGWSAEFSIPLKSLSFDPGNRTWGFNVIRAIRRKQEVQRWSGFTRARSDVALPELGEIRGLEGLHQGRGLELKPYASVTRRSRPRAGEKSTEFNPGLDVVWHVTPSLAATLTFNTDFADAEVDERQVNLGRFPLFFPEKRSFFTQDAALFTFGGILNDPVPFYSRRIGLAADGTKIDLLGGAKLTGRTGPWTIGLLDVMTDEYAGVGSKNLFVGRVARQLLAESSVGVITTHGDPRTDGDNSLLGVDFAFVNSHLPGDKSLSIRGSIQATDSDFAGGQGTAATVWATYPNEPFSAQYWYSRVDDRFDPALGFVSRTGIQDFYTNHDFAWRPKKRFVESVNFFVETDHITDLGSRLLDDGIWTGIHCKNARGDWFNIWGSHRREAYAEPFAIRPGIIIPVGHHGGEAMQLRFGTATSRAVSAEVRWQHGDYLTGRQDDLEVEVALRAGYRVELDLATRLRNIRLPQGDFRVQTVYAKSVYNFSPDLQLSLLGQYDNLSETLGMNCRMKWIVQPGNEVFLVVNQGYDTSLDRLRPTGNETSLKGAWTYRY
ncbi:MAG: carbohydrate binding family 9 domain-containing protein [Opitutaceae bacterium]|nr:carbohydrate binding family 9 domain-containing protein [Opitutaceae bacterium]